jgi:hypothetical protein
MAALVGVLATGIDDEGEKVELANAAGLRVATSMSVP